MNSCGGPIGEARRAALDQHRADAADAGPVAHVDQEDRGLRAEGREHLGAVDDVVRAVRLGAGLEIGHGRAGVRLAHAEADHGVAGEAFGQPLLLLILGAVFGEGADRAEIAELHHVGAARADRGDLLDGDHRVHQRAALAAVGLGDGDAHQALRGSSAWPRRTGNRGSCARFERVLRQMRLREAAHGFGEQLLLFGEVEVHGVSLTGLSGCSEIGARHGRACPGHPCLASGKKGRRGCRGITPGHDVEGWSLRLHAGLADDLRPLGLLAGDVGGVFGRADRQRLGAFDRQLSSSPRRWPAPR